MLRYDRIGLGAARDFVWREARGALTAFADHPEEGCIGGRILPHDPSHAHVTIDEHEALAVVPAGPRRTGIFHGANLSVRRTALERPSRLLRPARAALSGTIMAELPRLMAAYNRCRGAYYA